MAGCRVHLKYSLYTRKSHFTIFRNQYQRGEDNIGWIEGYALYSEQKVTEALKAASFQNRIFKIGGVMHDRVAPNLIS